VREGEGDRKKEQKRREEDRGHKKKKKKQPQRAAWLFFDCPVSSINASLHLVLQGQPHD